MNEEQRKALQEMSDRIQRDLWQFTGKTLAYIGTLRAEPETRAVGIQLQEMANVAQAALIGWRKLYRRAREAGFPDRTQNVELLDRGAELHDQLQEVFKASEAKTPGVLMQNLSRLGRVAGEVTREVVGGVVAGGQEMLRGLTFLRRNWLWVAGLGVLIYLTAPAIAKAVLTKRRT